MKRIIPLFFAMTLAPMLSFGQTTIVDDTFQDGRNNAGALQADWWYASASGAIATQPGELGLLSGPSNGRAIDGTFASQSLGIGDMLTATFTFWTPATVGNGKADGFKIGLYDTTGHSLAQDITAATTSPNSLYNNLNGYALYFDVNTSGTSGNVNITKRSNASSGQLLAASGDYSNLPLPSGGSSYVFAASTEYTGVFSLTRTGAGSLDLTGSLYTGANTSGTQLTTYTQSDASATDFTYGMLGFADNSGVFGNASALTGNLGTGNDSGPVFVENIITFTPAPEPTSLALISGGALVSLGVWGKRKLGRKS